MMTSREQPFVQCYTQPDQGERWLRQFRDCAPIFACVLGFTQTGLIPGISAAGATPHDRQYTAIADAEFLVNGVQPHPRYPLPPLQAGASPVLLSRAVLEAQTIPIQVFNAGLPVAPAVPAIDLGGIPARCLSTGAAIDLDTVKYLLEQGLHWGDQLATQVPDRYVILSECVVGGTTTALAVLTGLGIAASGKVNSSHPTCNHAQKWQLVQQGLNRYHGLSHPTVPRSPLALVAAIGDPMQVVVAGMAIAASRRVGVLLAGGTQMLAVYALTRAITQFYSLAWQPDRVVVGTTRWVAEDPTGDTVGLAQAIADVPLLGTRLSLSHSRHPQLRVYEQGFVKEGVGAGGCAIAAHLYQHWHQAELLSAIDALGDRYLHACQSAEPNSV